MSKSKTKATSELQRWLVLFTASLMFFYTFIQMNMLNTIGSQLMHDFAISAGQFGLLSAMYFYGNFFLLFPAGLLLDRFSPRKMLIIVFIIAIISMFSFAYAPDFIMASISRLFMGFSGAFAFLAAMRIVSRWFPPTHMALASGVVVTLAMIGGAIAQAPIALAEAAFGWRNALLLIGFLGIGLLLLVIWFTKDYPAEYKAPDKQHDIEALGFWHSIRVVITNIYNWLCGLYTTLMNLPIFVFGLWGSMYLTQVEHIQAVQAASIDSMLFIGTLIGSPIVGWISDKIKLRVLPMIVGAIVALALILIVIYKPHLSVWYLLALFFSLGFITSTQVLGYPLVTELNSSLVTGSALSIISLLIMASGFIVQPLFGWLLELHWNHFMWQGIAIYSIADFRLAMLILPIGFIASLFLSLLIKESRCRRLVK